MMKNISVTNWIDLTFCLVFLPALIMLLPIDKWWEHRENFVFVMIAWLYTSYGLQRLLIVPKFLTGKNKDRLLGILLFFAVLLITHIITEVRFDDEELLNEFMRRAGSRLKAAPRITLHKQATWFLFVIVSTFSTAVALFTQLHRQISLRQQIEFEKKRAELALYKAQINPHFLFNTLNTLYGMVVTKAERTEEVFMLFTNLMKYIYSNSTAQTIPLADEMEHINEYIELQKLRLNSSTNVDTNFDAAMGSYSIAPMLLITFVENAFKYGVSSHSPSRIKISTQMQGETLIFKVQNQIISRPAESERGIGIENCRKRLELLYSNAYNLKTQEIGDIFFVELKIKLR